jgi:CobQ-like glutamine amidotransferase family enzyme
MHGPALARNPELADAVLQCAAGPLRPFNDPLADAFAKERRQTLTGN